MTPLFELEAVSLVSSRGERLLAAVSCQFYAGEFVALLGPSGAGKSTLFKIMNRLKSATDGALYFIGRPLAAMPVRELRQRVMLVGQNSQLLNMTVKQALHYPLAIQQCSLKEQEVRVDEWLDRLQIPLEWLDQTELQLSGGQKQQVAIARALIARPQLLLLDEPTSALDLGAATRILTVIREEIEKRDLAVVMSNHQLELAQDHCDRILYLENGQLQLDQPADKVDWAELRQKFLTADASSQEEWGDSDEAF